MRIGIAESLQRAESRGVKYRIATREGNNAVRSAFARLTSDTPDVSLLHDAGGWEAIKREAERHGMSPLLAHTLRPHLPPEDQRWADQILRRAWRRHEQMVRHLDSLIRILTQAGLRPFALKGPMLALRHYEPAFLRKPSNDLDLGIPLGDLRRACEVLTAAGYRLTGRLEDDVRHNHHAMLSHPSMPLVELHFRLSHRALGLRIEPFWERARPFRLPTGQEVLIPDAADEIFHLMLHHAGGVATFFHLWEIRRLWSMASAEVRASTIETAARYHFSGVLALIDLALRKYWGESLFAGRTRTKTDSRRTLAPELYDEFERLWEPGCPRSADVRLRRRWLELRLADRPTDALRLVGAVSRIACSRFGSLPARLKQTILSARHANSLVVRRPVRSALAVYAGFKAAVMFGLDGSYREIVLLRLFRAKQLHQSTPVTRMDRYPGIFAACRDHLADRSDLRILSFGCATGEEVLTLRQYFPTAFVVGAEINRHSLRVCKKRTVDERIAFVESEPREVAQLGPFDAIFCMAVLQRTPMQVVTEGVTNLKMLYPFEKFDEQVRELDSWLKPGGMLVIHHSQYRVADSSAGRNYAPLAAAEHIRQSGPHFDRESKLRETEEPAYSVFLKMPS